MVVRKMDQKLKYTTVTASGGWQFEIRDEHGDVYFARSYQDFMGPIRFVSLASRMMRTSLRPTIELVEATKPKQAKAPHPPICMQDCVGCAFSAGCRFFTGISAKPKPKAPDIKTLRDDFAMEAMVGLLAGGAKKLSNVARGSYALADEMLVARGK